MPRVLDMPVRRCRPSEDTLFDQIELSRDIEISRREFAEGKGIPSDVVFNRLHEKLLSIKAVRG